MKFHTAKDEPDGDKDSQGSGIVDILDSDDGDCDSHSRVRRLCFGIFINFLKGNSTKNRNYLARNIQHIYDSKVRITNITMYCGSCRKVLVKKLEFLL